ncbi:hypothetical protein ABT173_22340 [Streptomyces sp. NPDC001795]|uniref:hypothetical protein n=1 Tax=Streptomyces sp. NPDC001795 TaxID=3154525 RepID=UPI003321389B
MTDPIARLHEVVRTRQVTDEVWVAACGGREFNVVKREGSWGFAISNHDGLFTDLMWAEYYLAEMYGGIDSHDRRRISDAIWGVVLSSEN